MPLAHFVSCVGVPMQQKNPQRVCGACALPVAEGNLKEHLCLFHPAKFSLDQQEFSFAIANPKFLFAAITGTLLNNLV